MTVTHTLRLYGKDGKAEIDRREMAEGALSIGRDPAADWTIADPSRTLSRRHCVVTSADGELMVTDLSANGLFIGARRRRVAPGAASPLPPGEPLHLGDFRITAEIREPDAIASTFGRSSPGQTSQGVLIDAFCHGAGLDPLVLALDDPLETMRRLGEVYRQMVGGLSTLMSERTLSRTDLGMEKTRVKAGGNNPFRWAGETRLALDLLKEREDGFLSGAQAVKASFAEVRKHMLCTVAGARAALSAIRDGLSPEAVERRSGAGRPLPWGRESRLWRAYRDLHAAHLRAVEESGEAEDWRHFRAGYEERRRQIEATEDGG